MIRLVLPNARIIDARQSPMACGFANFNDFTKLLPSVTFQTLQPGQTTVYIRGVASGGGGNHSGPLPSVGVYLDEQPVRLLAV